MENGVVLVILLLVSLLLVVWIRRHFAPQNSQLNLVMKGLWQCNHFVRLLQDWREDNGLRVASDHEVFEQFKQLQKQVTDAKTKLDAHPIIANNEYWLATQDHWQRFSHRGGQLADQVRFLQLSNMLDNLLQVLQEESQAASKLDALHQHTWLVECTWYGLTTVCETLLLMARHSAQVNQYENRQNDRICQQIELYLLNLKQSHAKWLEPLNRKEPALDSALILRTLSSTERVIRVYHQEFVSQKHRNIASQSLLSICNEALHNVRQLQQHQITYIANHFQLAFRQD